MILFYTNNIQGNIALLDPVETRHCTQVLRRQIGDTIQLVDGKGNYYEASLIDIKKKACLAQITKQVENFDNRSFHLHIGIAPTKNMDRLESVS